MQPLVESTSYNDYYFNNTRSLLDILLWHTPLYNTRCAEHKLPIPPTNFCQLDACSISSINIYLSVSVDVLYDIDPTVHFLLPRALFGIARSCTMRRCCMRLSERENPAPPLLLQPTSGQSYRLGGSSNVSGCFVRTCLLNNLYDSPQNSQDLATNLFGL